MHAVDQVQLMFLLKGTRGDVQPAAVLAQAIKQMSSIFRVSLATHACHKGWLCDVIDESVQSLYMASKPARTWHKSAGEAAEMSFQSDKDLEESVAACQAGLLVDQEQPDPGTDTKQPMRALIIFNLFALEGFHLAEALGVPCLAISPCLVPYSPPASFARRFRKSSATLYQALQGAKSGQVGWHEVDHWMWPLFAPRWANWRQSRLRMPPVMSNCFHPPQKEHDVQAQSKKQRLSTVQTETSPESSDGRTYTEAPEQNNNSSTPAQSLPNPVPLLYGLSPQVIQQPGYWPESIHICGFWQHKSRLEEAAEVQSKLQSLLGGLPEGMLFKDWHAGKPLMCITFGSMGPMGAIPDPLHLVEVLVAALKQANIKGVLLTGGWKRLSASAWTKAFGDPDPPLLAADRIPHDMLLPMCDGIVQHGGAGTCAAAMRAGLPQLICPFHFDQHTWVEKLAYMGVALQGTTQHLTTAPSLEEGSKYSSQEAVQTLVQQLKALLSESMKQQCQELQARLLQEDGVATALQQILEQAKLARVPQADAALLRGPPWQTDKAVETADGLHPDYAAQKLLRLPNGWQVYADAELEAKFIYNEIFGEEQTYSQHGIQINDGDVVMDVGANVGLFLAWLMAGDPSKGRGIPSRIWACEPLPANLARLNANLHEHGLTDKVQVIPSAVSSEEGELQFRYYPHMPGNSTCHVAEKEALQGMMPAYFFEDAEDHVCPITTISKLMEDYQITHIDLLKVDVEGSELQVLQGIQPHHWPHIKQVVLETHDVDNRLQQVSSLLQQQDYTVAHSYTGLMTNFMVYAVRIGTSS